MVKKTSNKKKGKMGSKTKQQQRQAGSRLPIDLIVLVAEHLIGQHAFGTTANLGLTCRAVHRETLPVLYETVPLFSFGRLGNFRSLGFKFTKYVFDQPDQQHFGLHLPNLVLQIEVDRSSKRTHGDACDVVIHKPVSTATLFTILETPIYRQSFPHDKCGVHPGAQHVGAVVQAMHSLSINSNPSDECTAERAKPRFRPVDAISRVDIEQGAYLHDRAPSHLQGKTYDLTLYNAGIPRTESQDHALEHVVPSVVQLLKLASMQSSPTRLRDLEKDVLERHEDRWGGRPGCLHTRDFVHRHIRLYFDVPTMKAYIAELRRQVKVTPEILQYRLDIELSGVQGANDLRTITDQLYAIYVANLTSPDLVLPISDQLKRLDVGHIVSVQVESEGYRAGGFIDANVEGGRVIVKTGITDYSDDIDD